VALALGAGAAARLGRRRDEAPAAARGRERAGQCGRWQAGAAPCEGGGGGGGFGERVREVGTTASGVDRGGGAASSDRHVK